MELSKALIAALGDDYKEEMSAEDVLAALGNKKIVDLSKGGYVSENKYTDALNGKKQAEDDLNALKIAQMSDEDKAKLALEQKDNEIAKVTKELRKAQSEKVFAASGLKEEDYKGISEFVGPEQAVSLVGIINKVKKEAEDAAKEEALRNFKSPDGGDTGTGKKWGDLTLDEKNELFLKNPTMYNKLKEQK